MRSRSEKSSLYRQKAAESLRLAKSTADADDSAYLLDRAFRWRMLAQNATSGANSERRAGASGPGPGDSFSAQDPLESSLPG